LYLTYACRYGFIYKAGPMALCLKRVTASSTAPVAGHQVSTQCSPVQGVFILENRGVFGFLGR
jgi:hypothetical protein